ncbi:hypothetical protein QOT17_017408 [Balamuthia mandrillaris]
MGLDDEDLTELLDEFLLVEIFRNLSWRDLPTLALVCRRWCYVAQDPLLQGLLEDTRRIRPVCKLTFDRYIYCLSQWDGLLVAGGGDNHAHLWSAALCPSSVQKQLEELQKTKERCVARCVFASGFRFKLEASLNCQGSVDAITVWQGDLVTGCRDGNIQVWSKSQNENGIDVADESEPQVQISLKETLQHTVEFGPRNHVKDVKALTVWPGYRGPGSVEETYLVSNSANGSILLWSRSNKAEKGKDRQAHIVHSIELPDEQAIYSFAVWNDTLFVGCSGAIFAVDPSGSVAVFRQGTNVVRCLSVGVDNKYLFSTGYSQDICRYPWFSPFEEKEEEMTQEKDFRWRAHSGAMFSVQPWSQKGYLFSIGHDMMLKVWTTNGELVQTEAVQKGQMFGLVRWDWVPSQAPKEATHQVNPNLDTEGNPPPTMSSFAGPAFICTGGFDQEVSILGFW